MCSNADHTCWEHFCWTEGKFCSHQPPEDSKYSASSTVPLVWHNFVIISNSCVILTYLTQIFTLSIGPWQPSSVQFQSNYYSFISTKCTRECLLWNGGRFVSTLLYKINLFMMAILLNSCAYPFNLEWNICQKVNSEARLLELIM